MSGWGKRIAEAREAIGLSQTRFGERIGAAQGTISGWETEAAEPTLEQLIKIAEITGYNVCWIAFNSGPPRRDMSALEDPPLDRTTTRKVIHAISTVLRDERLEWTPSEWARNTIALHDTHEGAELEEIIKGVREQLERARRKRR